MQDIDSVGQAFDHLLRLLEKAEADGNYNAAAQLMRQRLQAHGMLRDRLVLTAENLLSDDQLIERLSGGDPEKLAAFQLCTCFKKALQIMRQHHGDSVH